MGAVLDAFPLVQVVTVGAEPAVDGRFVHADKTVRVLLFAEPVELVFLQL
jgi:hypothetical protein